VEMLLNAYAYTVPLSNPCQVIIVEDGEVGYWPFGEPFASAIDAAAYADRLNDKLGVTPAQRSAYTFRSMFVGCSATEADFPNAKPLLAEFQCSAAGQMTSDCAPARS
jgi:hypothetical protein